MIAAEAHKAIQARMLDRLADYHHQIGNIDKAAGLMFERSLIVTASSVTAKRYTTTKGQQN